MNEDDELLDNYGKVITMLNDVEYLIRYRVPIEQWPRDLAALCSVNEELLGPKTEDKKAAKNDPTH